MGFPWDFVGSIGTSMLSNLTNYGLYRSNRRYMTNMSNTAIQRSMQDMKLAGINPILAASTPASSPSPSLPQMEDPGQEAFHSARSRLELKAMDASIEKTRMETESIRHSMEERPPSLVDQLVLPTALSFAGKNLQSAGLRRLGMVGFVGSLVHGLLSHWFGSDYYSRSVSSAKRTWLEPKKSLSTKRRKPHRFKVENYY